ncbi:hypothetical protein HELRODRAFT_71383 [Helobdella robusta]|uniref:Cytochrome c oxidase assembly protein COX11, mitochondrial n=1 Tax=Helobdella robusta TaxID=6412 RepID=T1G0K6_HELRO|nr:hypothetical protein HELRODRAFT_71383 [Helobdella robusta]ESO11901.1 hypothetical protein HELRODRAFT_71383 [Helobdella robusta]
MQQKSRSLFNFSGLTNSNPPCCNSSLLKQFTICGLIKKSDEKHFSSNFKGTPLHERKFRSSVLYFIAAGVFMIGATYAGVPLYRVFCQRTGLGGEVRREKDTEKLQIMKPVTDRVIKVRFNADVSSSMQWNFKPQQAEIGVLAGETALAFYRAKNPTDKAIIGISTYNVVPFEAGPYFNKIQCFCFEEQRLGPHEEVFHFFA